MTKTLNPEYNCTVRVFPGWLTTKIYLEGSEENSWNEEIFTASGLRLISRKPDFNCDHESPIEIYGMPDKPIGTVFSAENGRSYQYLVQVCMPDSLAVLIICEHEFDVIQLVNHFAGLIYMAWVDKQLVHTNRYGETVSTSEKILGVLSESQR